jgi:hypothetical protein
MPSQSEVRPPQRSPSSCLIHPTGSLGSPIAWSTRLRSARIAAVSSDLARAPTSSRDHSRFAYKPAPHVSIAFHAREEYEELAEDTIVRIKAASLLFQPGPERFGEVMGRVAPDLVLSGAFPELDVVAKSQGRLHVQTLNGGRLPEADVRVRQDRPSTCLAASTNASARCSEYRYRALGISSPGQRPATNRPLDSARTSR